MSVISSRRLQDDAADILRRVSEGETLTVIVDGRAVAEVRPVQQSRPAFIGRERLLALMEGHQADAGLTLDLHRLAGDTTDDLSPG